MIESPYGLRISVLSMLKIYACSSEKEKLDKGRLEFYVNTSATQYQGILSNSVCSFAKTKFILKAKGLNLNSGHSLRSEATE